MVKIQLKIYVTTRESYEYQDFMWEEENLADFFPFVLQYLKATYPDGYVAYDICMNHEETAEG